MMPLKSEPKYNLLQSKSDVDIDQCFLHVKGPSDYTTQLKPKTNTWTCFRVLLLIFIITGIILLSFQLKFTWYITYIFQSTDSNGLSNTEVDSAKSKLVEVIFNERNPEEVKPHCPTIPANLKFDCYPEDGITKEKCENRGCCWKIPEEHEQPDPEKQYLHFSTYDFATNSSLHLPPLKEPYCYYPSNYSSYNMQSLVPTETGYVGVLTRDTPSYYPEDIKTLALNIKFETKTRLHFKVSGKIVLLICTLLYKFLSLKCLETIERPFSIDVLSLPDNSSY